ncbi:Hypothetical protein BAAA_7000747 [Brucella abortus str. 2308 A]|nr:Hypothetical protein BAAA_7000747 [Brucella abortus str. 2308 A]EPZ76739.1 hypothetical protein M798_03515 [Brucella melitensis ADMAS-G1]ERM04909.1 hypothetical protein P408_10365 [Brucella abortus S99]ERM87680.1 hypothetical protein P865_01880 [Brucella abortus 82]EXU83642.1 hypothetical protein AX23_04090 [Brucella melitensis 548]
MQKAKPRRLKPIAAGKSPHDETGTALRWPVQESPT